MTAQELANQLQQRKEKNLAFFAKYFPSIHKSFKDAKLVNAQLNLDPNTLEVNLVENGKAIYPLSSFAFNKNEAQQFSNAFKEGSMNHPLSRSNPKDFYRGRYGHGSLANFLEAVAPIAEAVKPYTFAHSLPQVVFLGSGLGLHISEFLKLRLVRHAVLVEHNPDRFLASLYVTDWEEIVSPYIQDQTRSFVLSVGDTTSLSDEERVHQAFAGAWNPSCMNVPFMPIQTVYYIHQADPFYSKVAERLNAEIEPYVNVWGYYDDEVNQVNHLFHNVRKGIKVFKKVDLSSLTKPVVVCGNGPSLDAYLPTIKKYRDKLYIVTAGTGTHSILENGITPDFMVTLESDYNTYYHLSNQIDPDKAKKTPIIGAAQINPLTFDFFGESLMYLKDETTLARIFDNNHDTVAGGTPTATNAAMAVVLDLNPKQVFLVGMDFGYLDTNKTHSDSSFYRQNHDKYKGYTGNIAKRSYKVQTNVRGDIYTTPFYNTGRMHAERKLRESNHSNVKNLTKGATIAKTKEFTEAEFESFMQKLKVNEQEQGLFQILSKQATKITLKDTEKAQANILTAFKKLRKQYLELLNNLEPNLESIEVTLFKINQLIINSKDLHLSKLNMFMRGMVWHWLTQFYALCKEFDAVRKLETFTHEFKRHFGGFVNYLPEHFESYLADKSADDPKLKLSVAKPEPQIEQWLEKIAAYKG